ncbi:MAG: hypothetical protein NC123_03070 [Butyrivibrio sp.]|nr:hypothetical protein [Acetatifactor muris]MCM1558522.1 hypothetical protein [Butyrivibrio sp.]
MAKVNIDIKKVRNANYNLPPMISSLSAQKKYVGMLRWRIPSEIQDRRNIRERLNAVLREMEKAEQQLNDIYKVTGSAVTQYMNVETDLSANAARFQ